MRKFSITEFKTVIYTSVIIFALVVLKSKPMLRTGSAVKKDDFTELKELIQMEIEEGIKIDEAEDELYGDKI